MALLENARRMARVARTFPAVALGRVNADLLLDRRVAADPQGLAIAYEDERVSWLQLRARADRLFAAEGVEKGDRVALLIDNRPQFLVVLHALLRLGAVGALINTNSSGGPRAHRVKIAEPGKLVFGSEHAHKLRELLPELPGLDPDRDVFIQRERGDEALHGGRCLDAEAFAAIESGAIRPG